MIPPCDAPGCVDSAVWMLRLLEPLDLSGTVVLLCSTHAADVMHRTATAPARGIA